MDKHSINIFEINENFISFFMNNIENLFDMNPEKIKSDKELLIQRIFKKNKNNITFSELSEIITQLYLISIGYEYLVFSFNLESVNEQSKSFDGIFFKDEELYYLEVKSSENTEKPKETIESKIKEGVKDVIKTKLTIDDLVRVHSNFETHIKLKSFSINLDKKDFNCYLEKFKIDNENNEFNIISSGSINTENNEFILKNSELLNVSEISKNCQIKKLQIIGLNSKIVIEFSRKIMERISDL